MQKVFALFWRETLVRHHGYVYGVRRFLNDLKADDAFGVLGDVADIAQVDLAVFGRPDEIGGTSINMLDHRKARAAGAAVIVRRQADAVADAVANQGGAARGNRGDQDLDGKGDVKGKKRTVS